MEAELDVWREVWSCPEAAQDWTAMPVDAPLPRPSPGELRRAARSIKQHTALGGDHLHPRSIALLDDAALEVPAVIFMLVEELGTPPLRLLVIVLLAKPDGGRRPIGLLTGLMRIWGKLRRRYAREWERGHSRPFFWGEAGRPASGSAHAQALRAEVARARGQAARSALLDMVK